MKHTSLTKNLLALAIAAVLATGCGGGSSSTPTTTDNASIGGSAAKGIIKSGIVKVFKIDSSGAKDGDAIAETVTADDGTYNLSDLPSTGDSPVLIELSVSGDTKMVCDALNGCGSVARGGDIDPPAGFTLRAVLPPIAAGASVNTQLTAFTDMATSRALASGSVTAAEINAANSEVSAIAGVNIREIQPVDITNLGSNVDTRQQQYALMNAAIADLVFANGGDLSGLQAFSDDFEDGILGNNGGALNPQDLIDHVNAEANDTTINDELSDTVRQQATSLASVLGSQIDDQTGALDPEPSSTDNPTEVAQAKALVTETRNWVDSFSSLESPAEAFSTETDTLTEILDQNTETVVEVLADVLDQVGKAINDDTTFPLTVSIFDGPTQLGTATVTNDSTSSTTSLGISATNISGVDITGSIALNKPADTEIFPAGDTSLTISGTAKNDKVKVTLNETNFSVGLATPYDTNNPVTVPNISTAQIAGGIEFAAVSNGVVTDNKISGDVEIQLVKFSGFSTVDASNMSLKKLAFTDLSISNSAGSNTLDVTLDIDNATSFDTLGLANSYIFETQDEYLDGTLTISGKLNLTERPEASASLVLNKTGQEKGDATLTIAHDGRSIVLSFSGDNTTEAPGTGTLTVSNSDGVSMTVTGTEGQTAGTVKVNDKTVGTIEEANNIVIIRYNDGSFESLGGSSASGSSTATN